MKSRLLTMTLLAANLTAAIVMHWQWYNKTLVIVNSVILIVMIIQKIRRTS